MRALHVLAAKRPSPRWCRPKRGRDFIHPYNDPRVIAGQATCSKEFLEQVEGLDILVAPIGGGGMISGTA